MATLLASTWLTHCAKPDKCRRSTDQIASTLFGMVAFPNDGRTNRHVIQRRQPISSRRVKLLHQFLRIAPEAGLAIDALSAMITGKHTYMKPPGARRPRMRRSNFEHGAEDALAPRRFFDEGVAD